MPVFIDISAVALGRRKLPPSSALTAALTPASCFQTCKNQPEVAALLQLINRNLNMLALQQKHSPGGAGGQSSQRWMDGYLRLSVILMRHSPVQKQCERHWQHLCNFAKTSECQNVLIYAHRLAAVDCSEWHWGVGGFKCAALPPRHSCPTLNLRYSYYDERDLMSIIVFLMKSNLRCFIGKTQRFSFECEHESLEKS